MNTATIEQINAEIIIEILSNIIQKQIMIEKDKQYLGEDNNE